MNDPDHGKANVFCRSYSLLATSYVDGEYRDKQAPASIFEVRITQNLVIQGRRQRENRAFSMS